MKNETALHCTALHCTALHRPIHARDARELLTATKHYTSLHCSASMWNWTKALVHPMFLKHTMKNYHKSEGRNYCTVIQGAEHGALGTGH
jgi:hypothetical protein